MAKDVTSRKEIPMPDAAQVGRAIRLTYVQTMLTAIFGASTGGMFLIGFAIELGADNILLGVMASIPQFFVTFQLLAAYFVERGVSRKWITVGFAFLSPLIWFLVAIIAFFGDVMNTGERMAVLIGIIVLVTLSGQFVANARGSWIGELVPAERRGRFFGHCLLFAGIVGSVFAIIEGRFLDIIKSHGLFAFAGLFFFGAVFGLASAALYIPQPECPLPGGGRKPGFRRIARETFRNRPFVLLALVTAVFSLSAIAGPFTAAYCLRDVGLSFFGLGILNFVFTAAMLLCSPFCGKAVDRFGCRPVLILGLLVLAPTAGIWLFIPPNSPLSAYLLLPWANLFAGLGSAAVSVAISSMMYKTSRPEGRSVQFAAFNIFATLVGAPMAILGGWLVSALQGAGYAVDLRLTFYLSAVFVLLAALVAKFLHEPESVRTPTLVFSYFPSRFARLWGHVASIYPFSASLVRTPRTAREDGDASKQATKR